MQSFGLTFESTGILKHGLKWLIDISFCSTLKELLKLRKKITTTVQVLTHLKEKLQFVQAENGEQRNKLRSVESLAAQVFHMQKAHSAVLLYLSFLLFCYVLFQVRKFVSSQRKIWFTLIFGSPPHRSTFCF